MKLDMKTALMLAALGGLGYWYYIKKYRPQPVPGQGQLADVISNVVNPSIPSATTPTGYVDQYYA